MQDEKAAALYKKFCGDIANENRLKRDFKRHNWLLMKLNKKLSNCDRSPADAAEMKPSSPPHKAKSAPKLRPTLPVCLPLSLHHKFQTNIGSQNNSLLTQHTEKKSLISLVKKKSISGTSFIIPQENKNFDNLKKTVENLHHVNNTELIYENKSTDTLDLADNAPIQPLHVIQINVEYDKNKIPVPVNDVSVQVPEKVCHDKKDICCNKLDVTSIPLPPEPKSTQTESINVIYGEDVELLRTVKRFNFTLEDLEQFNQLTILNNNNQTEYQNQNIVVIDLDEENNDEFSEQNVSENKPVENTSNNNEQTIHNNPLPNVNGQIVQRDYQSSSIATGIFERLKLWSDLNKIILRTFYEGILLGKEKDPDKTVMENHLSQLSQNLVDQICDMVTNYNEAYGRQISRVVEIVELDDCDDHESLLGKRPLQTDLGTSGQANGTKKIRTDAQEPQECPVQNNQVSPNIIRHNQETTVQESQYETTILETQNLETSYQESEQNKLAVNQIIQNQGHRTEETQKQSKQYQESNSQISPYHVTQFQMNPEQVTPNQFTENHITPNPVLPTRTQILQNQLVPAQPMRNAPAPVNEVRRVQNQLQNIPSIQQETVPYTETDSQRSSVLREFRMNSMPEQPVNISHKNDSRLPNYYTSYNGQPTENTLHPPHIQNVRKQIPRKRHFQEQTYPRWSQNTRYQDFNQNIQTPINSNYQTGNRKFQNVIQQNQQFSYNSPGNYQNTYPYNYRNSYAGDFRRW